MEHYHVDNSRFADNAFCDHVKASGQSLSFCGVNAHWQNGVAEKGIWDIKEKAQTMLLHAIDKWPGAITTFYGHMPCDMLLTFRTPRHSSMRINIQWKNSPPPRFNQISSTSILLDVQSTRSMKICKRRKVSTHGCLAHVLEFILGNLKIMLAASPTS